ncbi:MAG: UDP-glucose dehydrogenase family protein [Chloroflexota bacterium]
MSYNIGVIGTGYVGLVSGTTFAATGNTVYCVDIDEIKIKKLNEGICPIFEPGLERLIERNVAEDRLKFITELEIAVENCSIIFLCLPTPPAEDGSADLTHVLEAAAQIAKVLNDKKITDKKIIVNKSTVPVGTADKVRNIFIKNMENPDNIFIASNPEFLREGFAVEDALKPERVVVGCSNPYVEETMRDLYKPFLRSGNPIYIMDEKSAEVTKYAANGFLATKISFMNDLSSYCEKVGADIEQIRLGIGSDTRIGKRFLFAGIGYGGSCFPKDVRALIHCGEEVGANLRIVKAAQEVNYHQIERFYKNIIKRFDSSVDGKRFALWGLAFKPNTDDTREAPAFRLIELLLSAGAKVTCFDPEAMENTRIKFGDSVAYAKNMYDCLDEADALIVTTEWNEFRNPDFAKVKAALAEPIIFDGRNLYNPDEMLEQGIEYYCVGRKGVIPSRK